MGNNQIDSYFTEKPTNAANLLKRNYSYYWVDPNIPKAGQSRAYLKVLQEFALIHHIDTWQSFINVLDSSSVTKVCLITVTSLPPQAYTTFQSSQKIQRVILYSGFEQQNQQPIPDFPKIKKVCSQFQDLLNEIRELEVEERQNLHFFISDEINRLNRWMLNWLILQEVVREQGKKDFIELMAAIMPGSPDVKRYEKLYDISKIESERDEMVLDWIRANNFYLSLPTEFLSKIRDTFSFALIRQPLFDIYNTIRAHYALNNYPELTAYTRIALNRHQISILKERKVKFMYFSSYLSCDLEPGRKSLYANQFRFTLKLKGKDANRGNLAECSGYYLNQKSKNVILNLSNPFEVLEVDLEQREVLVQLVQVPKNDLKHQNEFNRLQLHRRFIRYLVKIIPGQILSSYFNNNNQLQTYGGYVKNELAILLSTTNANLSVRKLMRKLEMAKIKLYFHLQSQQVIERQLLQVKEVILKLSGGKNPSLYKVKVYFLLIELNFRTNDFLKFGKCLMRLKMLYQEEARYFNEQEALKLRVYSIYSYVSTNSTQISENMERLMEIEAAANSRMRQDAQVSELYSLIVLTKIKCSQLLHKIKKALLLFDELIQTIKICQGESEVYFYYHHLKLQLQIRSRKTINQREKQQKRKRVTSSIQLHQLFFPDPFALNLSSLDLSVYEVVDNQSQYFQ